jgi:hypothetical protein
MEATTSLKDKICLCISVFTMSLMGFFAVNGTPTTFVPPPSTMVQPQAIPQPPMTEPKPQPSLPPAQPTDPEVIGLQVPIPKSIRIYNKSGSQCVWCTAQMLGTYHNVKGVAGLTDQYKHATGPGEFNRVMTGRHVNFKQVTGRDLDFLEEWVTKKKMGCGIGVNNTHVILVCDFQRGKQVKVIDNSDRTLRVQTWSWDKFQRNFTGWVFVILPDNSPTNAGWDNNVDDGKMYGR